MADAPDPFAITTKVWPARYEKNEEDCAPPAERNEEFKEKLLSPMHEAMGGFERNSQVMPGPSSVGGCERKLAFQLLFPELHKPHSSGWAATKGTVLHAWYDKLCKKRGWQSDLRLPRSVQCVTGGTLDLFLDETVVDLKAPGTASMREAAAGRISLGYYGQLMVYGLGAEKLGLTVRRVGLLFVPMCGDKLDAVYAEWAYDRDHALAVLANAERIHALGQVVPDRVALLGIMSTRSDFCGTCIVLQSGMCPGFKGA